MDYTPITTEEAIDAVLKYGKLIGREIPDLRALIEGIQTSTSDTGNVSLYCKDCSILECQCEGLEINFNVRFYKTTFTEITDFANSKFMKKTAFDRVTFMDDSNFEGAAFTKGANFYRAVFTKEANFLAATFTEGALFSDTIFKMDANFLYAKFGMDALFRNVTFTNDACFSGTNFYELPNFSAATFTRGGKLCGKLTGADFSGTKFNGCFLNIRSDGLEYIANLESANLEHTKGLILDSTPIRNARFSPRASDPWSQLRRAYTGPRLVFTLMFLVAFFTPYVLKTVGWVGVNRVQEELKQHVEDVREKVEALESKEHLAARPLAVALEAVEDRLPHNNDARWQTKSVWELVLGMDKHWTYWVTAIVLLLYNLCRAGLTWFVAPMRDAEERSGVSPAYGRDTSNSPKKGGGWEVATWPFRRLW